MKVFMAAIIVFVAFEAFAQAPLPTETILSSTTTTQLGSQTVGQVKAVVDSIPLALPAGILAIVTILMDILMRVVPTAKPRSIFSFLGVLFNLIGNGLLKLSGILDQIVQNLKEPKA
jgi:hypothetical protein